MLKDTELIRSAVFSQNVLQTSVCLVKLRLDLLQIEPWCTDVTDVEYVVDIQCS